MSKLCKCTHNDKQHSTKRLFRDKACIVCHCESYTSQKNLHYILEMVLYVSLMIIITAFIFNAMIDLFATFIHNTDGVIGTLGAELITELTGTKLAGALMWMFISGCILTSSFWLFSCLLVSSISDYRKPIKSLGDRIESYPLD